MKLNRYFAIELGPIGFAESSPAIALNGKEVMRAIPSGPSDSFYVYRSVKAMPMFADFINIRSIQGELWAECVFGATSKSAVKKALSEYFAGIKLDKIRELV